MLKHYFFIVFITLNVIAHTIITETERTIWVKWDCQHTRIWEQYELSDSSPSQFRRNEFFEDIETLVQRDIHWEKFCDLLCETRGAHCIIPSLGFAILDKNTYELVGSIKFNISSQPGYLSIGYGLKPSARYQKLGSEIALHIAQFVSQYFRQPIVTLKKDCTKNLFVREWYEQGKKESPDFSVLLDYFSDQTTLFRGFAAYVDILNTPSLSILFKNGMRPTDIECIKYYCYTEPHYFSFCMLFLYPVSQEQNSLNDMVSDLLSKNTNRIEEINQQLKHIFNVPPNWKYLSLNREEKASLRQNHTAIISSELLSNIGN